MKVSEVDVEVQGSVYLEQLIMQNLRYSVTERYDFGEGDLVKIGELVNPIFEVPYALPNGLLFDTKAASITATEDYFMVGFGSNI